MLCLSAKVFTSSFVNNILAAIDFPKRRHRVTQLNRRSVLSVLFTTEISGDLSKYSLLRADWNPAFPILINVPIFEPLFFCQFFYPLIKMWTFSTEFIYTDFLCHKFACSWFVVFVLSVSLYGFNDALTGCCGWPIIYEFRITHLL